MNEFTSLTIIAVTLIISVASCTSHRDSMKYDDCEQPENTIIIDSNEGKAAIGATAATNTVTQELSIATPHSSF